MGSYKTPIKTGHLLRNTAYVFLGDANLAIRLEMSVNQKPVWREKIVWLACSVYDIQYAPWNGRLNLIYTPGTKRCHALQSINIGSVYSYMANSRGMLLEINAIDDYDTPELPEFTHMSPLEVLRLSRCPVPDRLDLSWEMGYHGTSTLSMSVVSQETGIPVDAGERERRECGIGYLDDIYVAWGLQSILD